MADFASSLPVRTENAGDLQIQIVDGTLTSNKLKVESDGSINTNSTISATNLDIRDLAFATDKVDVSGSSVTVTATNLDTRDLTFATDTVDVSGSSVTATVTATNLDIRDLAFATDKVDASGSTIELGSTTLAALENISATVTATDLDIRNLSAAQDSISIKDSTGNAFTTSNPLPVVLSSSTPGDEVLDYATAASVAAGASTTHSYTVTTGKTLTLQQVSASGTGKIKVEIKLNAATKVVKFNSTANTNIDHSFNSPQNLAAGLVVSVVITNLDKQAQDIYSTIEGVEN